MILAWVFVGLLLALAIARINQSNKVFWILFTSFMVGIAGSSIYNKCRATQCEKTSSSYCHTPLTFNTMSSIDSVTISEDMYAGISLPTAAGNGKLEFNDVHDALSKCCVKKRKEPPRFAKTEKVCLNILTHPEYQAL